ncbi:autophagy protein atg9, partial [Linderina pennispora]
MELGSPDGENAWSTVLTTISSKQTNDGDEEQAAVTVPTEATQSSVEDSKPKTPPVTAHTRGLTSTLSGRRQRHESLAAHEYQSSSPASTAPDTDNPYSRAYSNMYESQILTSTPPRRDSRGQRQAQQQAQQQATNAMDSELHDDSPPPDSFLIEVRGGSPTQARPGKAKGSRAQRSVGGSRRARASRPTQRQKREAFGDGRMFSIAEEQQHQQHQQPQSQPSAWRRGRRRVDKKLSYKERALQAWRDSRHLDEFFGRVYAYYIGKGALNIILSRVLHLATLAFVVALSTFVFGCVDHKL